MARERPIIRSEGRPEVRDRNIIQVSELDEDWCHGVARDSDNQFPGHHRLGGSPRSGPRSGARAVQNVCSEMRIQVSELGEEWCSFRRHYRPSPRQTWSPIADLFRSPSTLDPPLPDLIELPLPHARWPDHAAGTKQHIPKDSPEFGTPPRRPPRRPSPVPNRADPRLLRKVDRRRCRRSSAAAPTPHPRTRGGEPNGTLVVRHAAAPHGGHALLAAGVSDHRRPPRRPPRRALGFELRRPQGVGCRSGGGASKMAEPSFGVPSRQGRARPGQLGTPKSVWSGGWV